MSGQTYILTADGIPVRASGAEWATWFQTANRVVKQENVAGKWVSTVFLGIDHNWSGEGEPMLFETYVFPSRDNLAEEWGDRCATLEEAEAMHVRGCEYARSTAQ